MHKKILIPTLLIMLVLVNIFQFLQMNQFKKDHRENIVLLLQAATGKTTNVILEKNDLIDIKDVEVLYNEYANNKKNFLYITLTNKKLFNKGTYDEIFNAINDREFENYLLEIYSKGELAEKDLEILKYYKEEYDLFKNNTINDITLTTVNNLESMIVAYSNLVKKANDLVLE